MSNYRQFDKYKSNKIENLIETSNFYSKNNDL